MLEGFWFRSASFGSNGLFGARPVQAGILNQRDALNQKSSTRKAAGYVRDEREPARRSKQYIIARERESALVFTKCERTALESRVYP